MSYTQPLSVFHPGLLVFILDRSFSMEEGNKSHQCANAVNECLRELILRCSTTDADGEPIIRNRCEVVLLGYGQDVVNVCEELVPGKTIFSIEDLTTSYKEIQKRKAVVSLGEGETVEVEDEFPIWLQAMASGGTPMGEAFAKAYEIASRWVKDHPESFPPILINITDGEPNNQTLARENALKFSSVNTSDGAALIFNVHITTSHAAPAILPSSNTELPPSDRNAHFLFEISSPLPELMLSAAQNLGCKVKGGSRALAYNADSDTLVKLLNIGSAPTSAKKVLAE
ncbi:VWA domain-containing protein [Aetokthonos hydrillicola Thurmond2011]|jgi:hypothetical protein|uniref:VWA domain-containing protein n=1 Tax=Aetokthonos hydrillicola Thurmond2011 TaxID=2712845 RepID=A0AAP5ICY3_9CYAN|nr:VWA domain-containing protein [Aetokthonos hydrillicola]MBW4589680.1 VWA domain-containing protein [Aetokthonos hydrillicola CCALA 1050]MDR9898934.1 VWA domain-containing protein [Aetokthonos hydrillicola Thurmond2011]